MCNLQNKTPWGPGSAALGEAGGRAWLSRGKQIGAFHCSTRSIWHRPWEALVRDFSLAFVRRPPLATLSVCSLIFGVPQGLQRLKTRVVGSSQSPEAPPRGHPHLSAAPPRGLPAWQQNLRVGTCALPLASFTQGLLGSPAAAQLPAKLPDLSAGAFTRPSRWLLLLLGRHPSWTRLSCAAGHLRQGRRTPGSQPPRPRAWPCPNP